MPDTTGPDTTIVAGPKGKTTKRKPRFEFTSSDPTARFECRVDDDELAACASPRKLRKLKYGKHTFGVVAIDPTGNRGPAAERRFKVARKTRK